MVMIAGTGKNDPTKMLHSMRTGAGLEQQPRLTRDREGKDETVTSRSFRVTSWLPSLVILFGLVVFGTGFSNGDSTATPQATPTSILQQASSRLADTKTVRFKLSIEGETFIDSQNSMQLLSAEGDLERPDKVSTTFKAKVMNAANVTVHLITIGDQSWWTNLVSGKWEPAPKDLGYNPAILFDNQGGIGPIMGKVQNPKLLESESVDGHDSYHIQATVPAKVIGPLTADAMVGDPITVDLWINEKTYDLLRIKLTEPTSKEHPHPAIWTLDLSRQNEKVSIEPPT